MDPRWLAGRELSPHAELRLFCLPYAGGSATVYREWPGLVPAGIQVCPLELPGRGTRLREEPFTRLEPLVAGLAGALQAATDRPFALFGHSMGALVAFELARALRERGSPAPVHLFVSAKSAPDVSSSVPSLRSATDEDVVRHLRTLGGTPPLLLENAGLMRLMLPTLRADFSVIETYEYRSQAPLPVPITVFGGVDDEIVPPSALDGWREQSSVGCRLRMLPGGHFLLRPAAAEITAAITRTLTNGKATRALA